MITDRLIVVRYISDGIADRDYNVSIGHIADGIADTMTETLTDNLSDTLPDKKTTRQDAKVTRLDVRLPNDLHATIEAIAKANGEPIHHISGNIILTPTVVKLIRLGISSLSGEYRTLADLPTTAGQVSDNLTPRMVSVESEVSILKKQVIWLEDKLKGLIVSDKLSVIAETVPDTSPANIPDKLPDTSPDALTDNSADIITDGLADRVSDNSSDNSPDKLSAKLSDELSESVSDNLPVIAATSSDISADTTSDILTDNLPDNLPKRLEGLTKSQIDRASELFAEGVRSIDRNNELAELFKWSPDKTPKSKNEEASRIKKALKQAGLIS